MQSAARGRIARRDVAARQELAAIQEEMSTLQAAASGYADMMANKNIRGVITFD